MLCGKGIYPRWAAKRPQQQRLNLSDAPRCQVWVCCAAQREQAPSPQDGARPQAGGQAELAGVST